MSSHPLHSSSGLSDMDEMAATHAHAARSQVVALPAATRPSYPPHASIPVSSSASAAPLAQTAAAKLPFSAAVPASTSASHYVKYHF